MGQDLIPAMGRRAGKGERGCYQTGATHSALNGFTDEKPILKT